MLSLKGVYSLNISEPRVVGGTPQIFRKTRIKLLMAISNNDEEKPYY